MCRVLWHLRRIYISNGEWKWDLGAAGQAPVQLRQSGLGDVPGQHVGRQFDALQLGRGGVRQGLGKGQQGLGADDVPAVIAWQTTTGSPYKFLGFL